MLRLIHTSDWHLGHHLHGLDREREHQAFLVWLLDTLEERAADALLIAGDIFDTANPSAAAQHSWFRFLGQLRRRLPALDVVVIAGNHDSASRLGAPSPILGPLGIHVVGAVRRVGPVLDAAPLLAPLHGADGAVAAWVAAVPFLRLADLPPVDPDVHEDPVIGGVQALYTQAFDAARAHAGPGVALIGMGHCYMTGGELSELSERRILGGNLHALPASLFPEDVAYVALGHLHKAQRVGAERVRYCGSPLPLSMTEATYHHQVLQVALDGETLQSVVPIPVPRTVDLLRVPAGADYLPVDQALATLAGLPDAQPGDDRLDWPFLEVKITLSAPRPGLRRELEAVLETKAVRLVRVGTRGTGHDQALADQQSGGGLADLAPEDVFRRRWARDHEAEPPDDVIASFHELVDDAHQELGR